MRPLAPRPRKLSRRARGHVVQRLRSIHAQGLVDTVSDLISDPVSDHPVSDPASDPGNVLLSLSGAGAVASSTFSSISLSGTDTGSDTDSDTGSETDSDTGTDPEPVSAPSPSLGLLPLCWAGAFGAATSCLGASLSCLDFHTRMYYDLFFHTRM